MMKNFSTSSFIGGLMVGLLLAGAWFFRDGSVPLNVSPSSPFATSTQFLPTASTRSGAISVANQPSGDTVNVESVTVPPPGVWVAVREMNGNELGNILGAARVSGPRSAISVSLLRATLPRRSYAIELYRDDSSGVFNSSTNSVYVDFDTGERVVAYFTTTE